MLKLTKKLTLACYLLLLFQCNNLPYIGSDETIHIPYGENPPKGNFFNVDGARLYYEVYGKGSPLIIIPGNKGTIESMQFQIEHFSKHFKVFIMDQRGRGKSEQGPDSLTYMQLMEDEIALLNQIKKDSAYVLGYSDGAIVALLMGAYYPEKVRRAAVYSANLNPDSSALYTETWRSIRQGRRKAEGKLAAKDTSKDWARIISRLRLMEFQPHIDPSVLSKIKAPVLVMTSDRDLIREEHTLLIYKSIPKASLCVLTGEKHNVIRTNPDYFNYPVHRFFTQPFLNHSQRFE